MSGRSRAKREFGFKAETQLQDGLLRTIDGIGESNSNEETSLEH